jgi:hypothetical protein
MDQSLALDSYTDVSPLLNLGLLLTKNLKIRSQPSLNLSLKRVHPRSK